MQEYGLIIVLLGALGLVAVFFLVFGDFGTRLVKRRIRLLARSRNWVIRTIRRDSRYGYEENMGPGSALPRMVFKVTYENEEGLIIDSIISSGFFGYDLEVEYEKARED